MARSKEFEVNTVLNKAMDLFWRQGYEKTSMQELVSHMGIHRRSLYDTFGDKHSLYMEVMNRYKTIMTANIKNRVEQSNSAKQAIRQMFEMTIYLVGDQPKGCLMVNTAVELAMHDTDTAAFVNEDIFNSEKLFYELITSGQQTGEIAEHHDAELLSYYLNNAWIGLRVMVKTTDDKKKLEMIVNTTLAILN
ncbi:TetR/AcrR family transcriptional regulator [Paenibacillus psychroresistens]|uniref:TetR/AcrR family transcriptional regulator n=1 Tax=Paenibacillus psychroresistens TaxID=1778678 RepID=A0A6B8RLI7_9BACL|nr:TetR/AcrR family transcriptional regulator [Paenibacillus psychroresistens]QGQ96889.1 TetR/AcrR family transcriptional regulator [Paenibacillus psychroresistens]